MNAWSPPLARMGLVVAGLLVFGTIAVAVLGRLRPGADLTELKDRVRSWWIMAAAFFGALIVPGRWPLVFFGFLSFWALKEYVTLLRTRPADHRALVWAFLAVPVQYYWVGIGWYGMFVLFIPVYMFLWLPVRLVLARDTSGFLRSAAEMHWGLMAFVFGLSHLAMLLRLAPASGGAVDGRSLVLFVVFVTELSDVLQYCWGKTLGRHRILPTVSPNKTWEGFLGGVASTALVALGVRFLTPFSSAETVGVALLVGVAGFLGGAVMSALKRDFGVKDFGTLLPGHGGMLDRVDSLCYAAPVFFHYVRYFYC